MEIKADNQYHIYNRGNNRETIFITEANYFYFKNKIQKHISPYADILAYCLMPNHFHIQLLTSIDFDKNKFINSYRIMLSSYTRAINRQCKRVGSLFQQNSKCIDLFKTSDHDYPFICFNYIHKNPIKGKLIDKLEDWQFSSFNEYYQNITGICNVNKGRELLNLPNNPDDFYKISHEQIHE